MSSDVKSGDSVLPKDSLETVFYVLVLVSGLLSWSNAKDRLTNR